MTNQMVERVARAMMAIKAGTMFPLAKWEELTNGAQEIHRARARAAIEAMREPTEAMASAALALDVVNKGVLVPAGPCAAWEAMIDAALSEPGSPAMNRSAAERKWSRI